MDRNEIEGLLSKHKPILRENYFVSRIGLFGSYARDEQTEQSDIDILVDFDGPIAFEFLDLKDYLERLFAKKVDLVTIRSLKPYVKNDVLNEVRYA